MHTPPFVYLQLLRCQITPLTPVNWILRGAVNAAWTFYVNDQDGAEVRQGGRRIPLVGERLYLIPPGCRYDADTRRPVRHLWGYFLLHGLPAHRLRGLETILPIAGPPDRRWTRLFTQEPTRMQDGLLLAAALLEVLATVLPEELVAAPGADERRLEPALGIIDRDYVRPIANAALAAACGLSQSHFQRTFRQVTGTTPVQALLARRVRAAAQLLLEGTTSLDAIAQACGLTNRTYLSRVFRHYHGIGPAAYREQNRR